jgi:PEP-CTERM motif-containing protein
MRKTPLVALLVLALPLISYASVVYDFSGTFTIGPPVTFTLTVPYYITATGTTGLTPDASFVPGAQLTCNACTQIDFYVDAVARGFTNVPSNTVGYGVGSNSYFFYFAPQSFTVNGTYTDVIGPWFSNQGTLIVSGTPVPEPSAVAMLAPALGFIGWLRRRRR